MILIYTTAQETKIITWIVTEKIDQIIEVPILETYVNFFNFDA